MSDDDFIVPISSVEDKRKYRFNVLPNGVKLLCISDPETVLASAAVAVDVGSLCDPKDLPGLAHFCEHMLFMGSKAFPGENDYGEFLAEHGGFSNAYTSGDRTLYYFDVHPDHLTGALEIFSNFFVSPLFTPDGTDRELQAVAQEHGRNLMSDTWRLDQLKRSRGNPDHPYSRFHTGSMETLHAEPLRRGINVRDRLIRWYEKHYGSGEGVAAVVLAKGDLEETWAVASALFGEIQDKEGGDKVNKSFGAEIYKKKQMGERIEVIPVKDLRLLEVMWPLPSTHKKYGTQGTSYIANMLGHEGEGSLLSALKDEGWATSLAAGTMVETDDFGVFSVTAQLTVEGEEAVDSVIAMIFSYVGLLQRNPVAKWFWDEQRLLADMNFRYKSKEDPSNYVTDIASNLHVYPGKEVLTGDFLFTDYDEEHIKELQNLLTPERCSVYVVSRKHEEVSKDPEWMTEPVYETKYRASRLQQSLLSLWNECVGGNRSKIAKALSAVEFDVALADKLSSAAFPKPNPFVPSDFELRSAATATTVPKLLKTDFGASAVELWHQQDGQFRKPKLNVKMCLNTPAAYSHPAASLMARLYGDLVQDCLAEYAYDAELAGLNYQLRNAVHGYTLTVCGFHHKLPVLLARIVQTIANAEFTDTRFMELREKLKRSYINFQHSQPTELCTYDACVCLEFTRWRVSEYLECVDSVTPDMLRAFVPQLLARMNYVAFVHGNANEDDARGLMKYVVEPLFKQVAQPAELPQRRVVQLTSGTLSVHQRSVHNPTDENSAIEFYLQVGVSSGRSDVLLELLAKLLGEHAFNELRTKQQLGYVVHLGVKRDNNVHGLRVVLQSALYDALYLCARVREYFLNDAYEFLKTFTEPMFAQYVEAVMHVKSQPDKTLSEQTRRLWGEINGRTFEFNRLKTEVAALRTVTLGEVLAFYERYVRNPDTHAALVTMVFGSQHAKPLHDSHQLGAPLVELPGGKRSVVRDLAKSVASAEEASEEGEGEQQEKFGLCADSVNWIEKPRVFARSMPLLPTVEKDPRCLPVEKQVADDRPDSEKLKLTAPMSAANALAEREAAVLARQAALASRHRAAAQRESVIARREAELKVREDNATREIMK